jgi:long-chain acyl-CoA synthetase
VPDFGAVPDDISNLASAVRQAAQADPAALALIHPFVAADGQPSRTVVTWGEFDAAVDAVAQALLRLSLPVPDPAAAVPATRTAARVAIALPNVPEFGYAFFGALRAGLVAVPINPGYTVRELRHQLADSGASVLIATAELMVTLAPTRPELTQLRYAYTIGDQSVDGARPFAEVLAGPADHEPGGAGPADHEPDGDGPADRGPEAGGEDLAVLLYTSGTAGAPRAAMLTHRALIANHRQVAQVEPPIVTGGDVVLLALPLFHAFGLNAGLGAIAWHAACGVLVDRFDPQASLLAIATEGVSVVTAVPQMFAAWTAVTDLRTQLASVRVAVSGAAPLGAAAARRFFEASGHRVFEGYGLTETAPVVATALASPAPKDGSIGRPIAELEIKLIGGDGAEIARIGPAGLIDGDVDDFDDDAGGVPGTDPGEIVVRGPNLFNGYWPDATGGPAADGWWPTGDIAYADGDGDLFLVDRVGDLIIVSGFNVYPHEVELVLAAHSGVREAAVIGVPSAQTGEAVFAYAVLTAPDAVSVAELRRHCELNLARFKCPIQIEFVDELPHSATGKVRKGTLREGAPA